MPDADAVYTVVAVFAADGMVHTDTTELDHRPTVDEAYNVAQEFYPPDGYVFPLGPTEVLVFSGKLLYDFRGILRSI